MSFPTFETEKFHFTPNKRLRETDLEMNINPIFEYEPQETKQPVVKEISGSENHGFIHNMNFNPFIKKNPQKQQVNKLKSYHSSAGNQFIPILDEHGIKKRDLRFSNPLLAKLNGQNIPVKNYAQLRNRILGMFYRKVLRPDADAQYCRDGLSIHGVGSKQNILAIINLVKILHFHLNLKLRLRDGQIVCLSV